ncbi:(2Fe-2S)-binding protein [Oceanibacterium hippocampi]|uniref:Bacterioferritin-associated ferredoxin n=1 Tax=Oceanibacterium hippocampi TaxID=745714 RepID=A0A1Y5S5M7_9PROT|nr:(2Fe-2S)-binding protein [Oceanibacterium hippocampi]SLN30328.1 BFD-like [2Fe-2S] binding domain protein [Oceanibacterium hippocampi]
MYVCICNGYRDSEIRDAAAGGLRCARRVYHALGGGPRCGQCLTMAQALVDSMHAGEQAEAQSGTTEPVLTAALATQGAD